jgi:hypothetical protein
MNNLGNDFYPNYKLKTVLIFAVKVLYNKQNFYFCLLNLINVYHERFSCKNQRRIRDIQNRI